jgi:Ca-activated chloride channel family protein
MSMLWPWSLLLLGLIPLLIALYVWQLRRRRRYAVRYSSLALIREALAEQSRWRRHLPFALFLLALCSLVLALTRPLAVVQVPSNQTSIILALDISRSMCATDIPPNRLIAAMDAARSFVREQPEGTRIGVVAFAGFAQLIQPPTTDQALLEMAIDGLTTGRGTAIGSAILTSLDAIAEVNPSIPASQPDEELGATEGALPTRGYAPEIIVVLTDGVTTQGEPPLLAAQQAAERGVRIYTIGFGTANPGSSQCGELGGGGFGGGGFGGGSFGLGGGFNRALDDVTLREVAALTDGSYYVATSAGELQRVFRDLPISYSSRPETTEISAGFAAFGLLLATVAIGIALLRHRLL